MHIIILAGGKGTRMNSNIPKVLHKVNNKEMIIRIIEQVKTLDFKKILIIVNQENINAIKSKIQKSFNNLNIEYIIQKEQLGTGDAIKCTIDTLKNTLGYTIIINGDMPLITNKIIKNIIDDYNNSDVKLLVTGIHLQDPSKNGRIFIDDNVKIIEYKDCDEKQVLNNLVNVGIYCIDIPMLVNNILKLDTNNVQNEYYLTDITKFIYPSKVHILENDDWKYILGVNDMKELELANNLSC